MWDHIINIHPNKLLSTVRIRFDLGCVCFGWKSLPEMLFRKWGCLVGPENSIFRKMKSVDPKNVPLTTEMLLHFYFTFKGFPKNERERERARARRRSSGIASSSSSPRSRSTARSRRRSRSREEGEIAIRRDRDLGSLRAVIAISDRDHGAVVGLKTFLELMIFFFLACGF